MHKHLLAGVVITSILVGPTFFAKTSATSSPSWLSSPLYYEKQSDISSLPSTVSGNGNIDCITENPNACILPTNYGAASTDGKVRFNGSGDFTPVITYMDGRQHYFPVPNSDMAISYYGGPAYGLYAAFNYSFTSSVTRTNASYTITKAPDAKIMDKSKHLLAADTASVSFSENGRFMVASIPNVAIARISLDTFDVLPFAPGFNYAIGLDPSVKTAVSNDGRYAVVSSNNFSTFKIYDLATCSVVPDTINSAVSCQSRDLRGFMLSSQPGFSFVTNARFLNDDMLTLYASYKTGTIYKVARYIISNSSQASQQDLLALGDSYISGEGAFDYTGNTDTNSNKCHVSFLAYPDLIGKDLNFNSYHSVACSGATTKDVTDTGGEYPGQFDKTKRSDRSQDSVASILASYLPGNIDQLDFDKEYQPKVVVLSIGGNDMGFSQIIQSCVIPSISRSTCYNNYEDRLALVRQIENNVYPNLINTYQQIKNTGPPNMRLYVIGYPQIVKPGGDCGLNVHLNSDELLFSQQLIDYIDSVIQIAAAKTGVYYVDAQDSLYGHRLCEAKPGSIAVNGLTAGNDRPSAFGGPIGDESYHPNEIGYQLLEKRILSSTHNLTNAMPSPNLTSTLPSESSLSILNLPHTGGPTYSPDYAPDISPDLAYINSPLTIFIKGTANALAPNTSLTTEIHSAPTNLGSYKTDAAGNLSIHITVPPSVSPGYHTLHFYGQGLNGQQQDIYKYIYIGKSADDLDGNGILDSKQKCLYVEPSNQDYDNDGIDDSCDPNITEPITPPFNDNILSSPVEHSAKDSGNGLNLLASQTVYAAATMPYLIGDFDQWEAFSNINGTGNINDSVTLQTAFNPASTKTNATKFADDKSNGYLGNNFLVGVILIILGCAGLLFKRQG